MFRQNLRGGHKVPSNPLFQQNPTSWKPQANVVSRSNVDAWGGENVDSAWNWDIANNDTNNLSSHTSTATYQPVQQTPLDTHAYHFSPLQSSVSVSPSTYQSSLQSSKDAPEKNMGTDYLNNLPENINHNHQLHHGTTDFSSSDQVQFISSINQNAPNTPETENWNEWGGAWDDWSNSNSIQQTSVPTSVVNNNLSTAVQNSILSPANVIAQTESMETPVSNVSQSVIMQSTIPTPASVISQSTSMQTSIPAATSSSTVQTFIPEDTNIFSQSSSMQNSVLTPVSSVHQNDILQDPSSTVPLNSVSQSHFIQEPHLLSNYTNDISIYSNENIAASHSLMSSDERMHLNTKEFEDETIPNIHIKEAVEEPLNILESDQHNCPESSNSINVSNLGKVQNDNNINEVKPNEPVENVWGWEDDWVANSSEAEANLFNSYSGNLISKEIPSTNVNNEEILSVTESNANIYPVRDNMINETESLPTYSLLDEKCEQKQENTESITEIDTNHEVSLICDVPTMQPIEIDHHIQYSDEKTLVDSEGEIQNDFIDASVRVTNEMKSYETADDNKNTSSESPAAMNIEPDLSEVLSNINLNHDAEEETLIATQDKEHDIACRNMDGHEILSEVRMEEQKVCEDEEKAERPLLNAEPIVHIEENKQADNQGRYNSVEDPKVISDSLWSSSQLPESPVKLSIAATGYTRAIETPQCDSLPLMNSIPLVVPSLINKEPEPTSPFVEDIPLANSEGPKENDHSFRTASHSFDHPIREPRNSLQHTELSSIQQEVTRAAFSNSPVIFDLTKSGIKQESNTKQQPPSFSRMVPGESTKGESSTTSTYQTISSVPAMPSGRVVTGNDDPQPLPITRIKQEPNEVRSPPDGPDTEPLSDPTPSVVPPVRSETIGQEESSVKMFPSMKDSLGDNISDSRRDRSHWDREGAHGGDYYNDRYRDRGGDAYRDDSPHSKRSYDRDFDSQYMEHRHRRMESDDEDDRDERRYVNTSKLKRNRGYRDELESYSDRYQNRKGYHGQRERRKKFENERHYRYSQDDDNIFYERSQPTSRSSSYTNLEGDGGHPNRDYYDRGHHSRDNRERDSRYRESRHHPRKEFRDPYFGGGGGYPMYQDPYRSREMYDPQSYYYYYQKYLEQHPYYREYYRQYYGRYGYGASESLADDKTSTRSGRSSVNEELKKSSLSSLAFYDPYGLYYGHSPKPASESSQFHQDFLDQCRVRDYDPSSMYPDSSSVDFARQYRSGDISGVASIAGDTPQRLTPLNFGGIHSAISFTPNGKLIRVLPHDPKEGEKPIVQIIDTRKLLQADKEYSRRMQKMKEYPGPLTVNETHKDIVIQFCERKVIEASKDGTLLDKESVVLLWNYLTLLVKQNGKVCGADLASLLLKTNKESDSASASEGTNSNEVIETVPVNTTALKNQAHSVHLFTEYLCTGRKREAVEYAVNEGLWGYAMTLAAKMDSVTHAKVTAAFMNSIPQSDVFQTLLQHLSGKRPEVTKNYSSERWGEWRKHLAALVSNPTGHTQRDQGVIIAFGDTLASKGQIHAAQLCYIAADAPWGTYSQKESKLVLLGSSHLHPFQAFASEDAIHCTEIYEYAKSLDSASPLMTMFQPYKLIYALRLVECGFHTEALKYCEVISQFISKNIAAFHVDFVSKVYDLACHLKYYDVHYQIEQGEISEMADPQWLQVLYQALYTLHYYISQQQQLQPSESTAESAEMTVPTDPPAIKEEPQANSSLMNSHSQDYGMVNPVTQQESLPQMYPDNPHGSMIHEEGFAANESEAQEVPGMEHVSFNPPPNQDNIVPTNFQLGAPAKQQTAAEHPEPTFNNSQYNGIHSLNEPIWHHHQQSPFQEIQHSFSSLPPLTPSSINTADVTDNRQEENDSHDMSLKNESKESEPAISPKEEIKEDKAGKKAGFISRLFGWRENNQAKLPDDKNPKIVWDDVKKKWVDKDGDESEDATPAPPPMAGMGVANPPASFRGTKKSRYVDPVGEKDIARSPAPQMPPMPSASPLLPQQQEELVQPQDNTAWNNQSPNPQQPVYNSVVDPQNENDGTPHVPLMGVPGGNVQPMFYSPGQFQGTPASTTATNPQSKRAGPARRGIYNPTQR